MSAVFQLHNSGIKHKNNPFMSAKTVRHSSTCIIIYVLFMWDTVACPSYAQQTDYIVADQLTLKVT